MQDETHDGSTHGFRNVHYQPIIARVNLLVQLILWVSAKLAVFGAKTINLLITDRVRVK